MCSPEHVALFVQVLDPRAGRNVVVVLEALVSATLAVLLRVLVATHLVTFVTLGAVAIVVPAIVLAAKVAGWFLAAVAATAAADSALLFHAFLASAHSMRVSEGSRVVTCTDWDRQEVVGSPG